ncbi:hypothetical protein VKT23_019579 [Stygiomarasmius scandens]|uniref:DUF6593 domain-containing protein n=1 Tax=Marasmiellus scandens TaxID=2682957 RepID=A0ABR1IMM6_9AGAR
MNFPVPTTNASTSHTYLDPNAPSHPGKPVGNSYPNTQYSNAYSRPNYGGSPIPPNQAPPSHSHSSSLHPSSAQYAPPLPPPTQTQVPFSRPHQNHNQDFTTFFSGDATLINSFLVTLQGLALYKTETPTGALGDKNTMLYKFDKNGNGAVRRDPGFPYVIVAEVETHSLSRNIIRMRGKELNSVKLSTWNGSVEFSGLDGIPYKWKYHKGSFTLQRRDSPDQVNIGSFNIKGSRNVLQLERNAMHILDECVAALVLGAKNKKETKEALEVTAGAVGGAVG